MMNNKAPIYVVLAVAVGYFLISALPQQVSLYTDQRQMLSSQPPGRLIEPEPEGGILGTSNSSSNDYITTEPGNFTTSKLQGQESDLVDINERSLIDFMSVYKWWVIDLAVALAVYFVAKRQIF